MDTFTLGCDPELVCRRDGMFVPSHRYFKSNSSFGLDGCELVAEVRPGYSESPLELTSKVRACIEYGHEKAPELDFSRVIFRIPHPLEAIFISLLPPVTIL